MTTTPQDPSPDAEPEQPGRLDDPRESPIPGEKRTPGADEAVQAVVDRVLSYQAGALEDTVQEELQAGLREIGADMPAEWVARTAARISQADPAQQE